MTHGAHDFASLILGGGLLVLGLNCAGSSVPKTNGPASSTDAAIADATPEAARPTELRAWFLLRTMNCPKDSSAGYGTCYAVTLSLHGAVDAERLVAKGYWAQIGCTAGANVHCDGPSGSSHVTLTCSKDGACAVEDYSVSDGYCEEGKDCGSRRRLDAFTVPAGTRIVFAKP